MGLFKKKEPVPELPKAPTLPELPANNFQESSPQSVPELPAIPSSSNNNSFNQEMVKSAVSDVPTETAIPAPEPSPVNVPEPSPVSAPAPFEPKKINPPGNNVSPTPTSPQFPEVTQTQPPTQPLTPMDAAIEDNAQAPSFGESSIPEPPTQNKFEGMSAGTNSFQPTTDISTFPKSNPIPEKAESPHDSTDPIFVRIDKFQDAQNGFAEVKEKIKDIESVLKKIKSVKSKEEEELEKWSEEIQKLKGRLSEIDNDIFSQI